MTRKIASTAAWLLAAIIMILSDVPPGIRPVVGSQIVEHAFAFAALGALFGLAYPDRAVANVTGLFLFCGFIEAVQVWIPGRHARLTDFGVDIAASVFGLVLAISISNFNRKRIWAKPNMASGRTTVKPS
jgi:hypothetical protein